MNRGDINEGTLCWKCRNAVPDGRGTGCTWSRNFKPVKGWEADKKIVQGWGSEVESYYVHECPKFIYG